jgi:hypothetical protein
MTVLAVYILITIITIIIIIMNNILLFLFPSSTKHLIKVPISYSFTEQAKVSFDMGPQHQY